jgi:hypothetical protein
VSHAGELVRFRLVGGSGVGSVVSESVEMSIISEATALTGFARLMILVFDFETNFFAVVFNVEEKENAVRGDGGDQELVVLVHM